jgi:hypothetical protein
MRAWPRRRAPCPLRYHARVGVAAPRHGGLPSSGDEACSNGFLFVGDLAAMVCAICRTRCNVDMWWASGLFNCHVRRPNV